MASAPRKLSSNKKKRPTEAAIRSGGGCSLMLARVCWSSSCGSRRLDMHPSIHPSIHPSTSTFLGRSIQANPYLSTLLSFFRSGRLRRFAVGTNASFRPLASGASCGRERSHDHHHRQHHHHHHPPPHRPIYMISDAISPSPAIIAKGLVDPICIHTHPRVCVCVCALALFFHAVVRRSENFLGSSSWGFGDEHSGEEWPFGIYDMISRKHASGKHAHRSSHRTRKDQAHHRMEAKQRVYVCAQGV